MSTDKLHSGVAPGVTESGRAAASAAREWHAIISNLATLEIRYSLQAMAETLVACLLLGAVLFSCAVLFSPLSPLQ